LRENPDGALRATATDDAHEVASQAAGVKEELRRRMHTHQGTRSVLGRGPAGSLPLLRGAHEWPGLVRVSHPVVVSDHDPYSD
jgi:hypothetical protein